MQVTRRSFGLFAAAAGTSLVANQASALATRAGVSSDANFDPTPYVNPELRKYVAQMREITVDFDAETIAKERSGPPFVEPLASPTFTKHTAPGPRGAPDVQVYVVNARPDGPARPAILHTHGGGFVVGTAYGWIRCAQEAAAALDCVVVSVDYRLAPETRFPGALEDNYAALKWLYANAVRLGVDRSRIAVMGESAGGGHAAMLAIAARDRGEIPLVFQALVYPMLDDRTGSTRKVPLHRRTLIWTAANNRFGWRALLGVAPGSPRIPYGAVPARLENLRGLPPAFIGVGSIDLFVDEDIDYGRRLADAGIPVTLNVVPGAFHGFDLMPSALVKPFRDSLYGALRDAFSAAR